MEEEENFRKRWKNFKFLARDILSRTANGEKVKFYSRVVASEHSELFDLEQKLKLKTFHISRRFKLHVKYPLQMLQRGNDFEYFMISAESKQKSFINSDTFSFGVML